MKTFIGFVSVLFRMAVMSMAISLFFTLCQWLLSLLSICGKPTWNKFWIGAAGIFVIWTIASAWQVVKYFANKK